MYKIKQPLFSPSDGGGSGGSGQAGSDSLDELSQDLSDIGEESEDKDDDEEDSGDKEKDRRARKGGKDAEEDDEDGGSGEDSGDAEDDEEPEEEEDEEREEEEDKEVDEEEPVRGRVSFKELKKEYPKLFKQHPELRAAFFEYPKYAEMFTDLETAQVSIAKATEYDRLEQSLAGAGNPQLLVKTLEKNSPKSLQKIVESFGDTIRDVDPKLYTTLATPIIEEMLYYASEHAAKIGGDAGKNLRLAARHIANWVFANGGEIPDISRREKADKEDKPTDREKELLEDRERYATREYNRAVDDIELDIKREMEIIYSNKLDDLTRFERKQVVKETRLEVDRILSKDKALQATLTSLWRRSRDSGYSDESKAKIRRAWLEGARSIAPKVRNRLRQEALDGRKASKGDVEDKDEPKKKRQFPTSGGRSSGRSSRVLDDPKKIDWRKTTDSDILNS